MASKWNRNRHWKWLSLQFNRRKFDHQPSQWNEGFWTVSMFNHQHVWQYFEQRGCSSVCMWVTIFLTWINQIFTLLDKTLNCNLNYTNYTVHWLCWAGILKLEIKCLVGKSAFLSTFKIEQNIREINSSTWPQMLSFNDVLECSSMIHFIHC